ncbi:MAG: PID-CTERM protein-sorting domain-containing protein [Janthinobacterium lividum]
MRNSFPTCLTSRLVPVVVGVFLTLAAAAQGVPGNGGTTGGPPPPTAVPLDGGASLLLASGVAYGLRRLRRRRQ